MATAHVRPVGEQVLLTFTLPNATQAEVRWSSEPTSPEIRGQPAGIGLRLSVCRSRQSRSRSYRGQTTSDGEAPTTCNWTPLVRGLRSGSAPGYARFALRSDGGGSSHLW